MKFDCRPPLDFGFLTSLATHNKDAIDGSEEGGDVDIEGAVRRALELTPNATETLEAKRFFEDIVESQRKQVGRCPPSSLVE